MTEKLLQEIFSRHLGDSSISEEAMAAFESRMEEFIRLSQVLERSEQSVNEQASEITALQEKETSCDDAISRQQKAQWELEKKLEEVLDKYGIAWEQTASEWLESEKMWESLYEMEV